mmetsp:Transcript_7830/g.9062  ORF Transcript_7830/g.9062 Transcript_7830/m.9062 type:complete len:183 (-) Transcript_7830:194-742(-)
MNKLIVDAPKDKPEISVSDESNKKVFKVCAMCCKAPALVDDDDADLKAQVEELKREMEQKLGRQLKLRESKAIERKVERNQEKEKQEAKERRRALRIESMKNAKLEDDEASLDQDDHCGLEDLYTYSKDEVVDEKVDFHSKFRKGIEFDEDDDLLKAVGGRQKLLTGEAYQKMLLEREGEKQ